MRRKTFVELVGISIEEARDAEGKRRGQKRENRIFDMLPEAKMTFDEPTEWYLTLPTVKKLASYDRVGQALNNFNIVFGKRVVGTIKPMELEEYQDLREKAGYAHATIDMEISIAKTMVTKAFDNDKVDGRVLKAFRGVKRKLRRAENARKRIVSASEFLKLCAAAPPHLKAVLIAAYNTGMRSGELRSLQWSHIDKDKRFVRLPPEATKEHRAKTVPINRHFRAVLNDLPRAIHHGFVFTYRGEPIRSRDGLKKSLVSTCKVAGIACGRNVTDGMTLHDIRRTVKTGMLSAGVDKVHRDVILGHSLHGMDVHYLVPTEDDLSRAMERFTVWLDEQFDKAATEGNTNVAQGGSVA